MKVLIATPTYGAGPSPQCAESIRAQDCEGWEWRQYRKNPYPAPDPRNVLAQYQAIRDDFLDGEFDALLTVEHDMVIPPHALRTLYQTAAPVVYGVYLLRHGSLVLNAWEYVGRRNLGESLSLKGKAPKDGRVALVCGVGNGCTLIRREIVERFPFHDGGDVGQSPDLPFAYDCIRNDVLCLAHFGVACGHLENGRLLMPMQDDMIAPTRIRMLQTVTANVSGSSMRLNAGDLVKMPADDADHLLRAGYAVGVDDAAGSSDQDDAKQTPRNAGTKSGQSRKAKRSRMGADSPV